MSTDYVFVFNPPSYGTFHLLWFLTTIFISIICCVFFAKKHNPKVDDRFIFVCGLILLLGEIFKQFYYTNHNGGYTWGQFPLQFCSMSLYFAPLILFIKNRKVKDAFYSFLAFCGLLAGIAVMTEPSGVFWYPYGLMVIHSCVWHSTMIIMGIYIIVAKGYGKKVTEPLKGLFLLLPSIAFAILFNEVMYNLYFKDVTDGNICNAFYISSHYVSNLPILHDLQPIMPYPLFIFLYVLAFILGILLLWAIVFGIKKVFARKH